ncbi:MAG: APC family permease [Nitrososphaeria archaeon]
MDQSNNKNNDAKTELIPGQLGLWSLVFMTVAAIYPMAMAVSNASAAVSYSGFAAPLVPLIGALLILFATVPILEYTRIAAFAGGYYGLVELGFGITTGKFLGVFRIFYDVFFDSLTATAFAYIIYTTFYVLFHYEISGWILIFMTIVFLVLMYLFTVINLRITAWTNNIIQILQIVILIAFSIYVILKTPYNSLSAFNPYVAPGGLSGFFLGVVLAGFLFYTGYGAPLYLAEEGVEPFKNVWKSIIYGVILTAVIGTLTMYSEVVSIGPKNVSLISSVLNPGLSAYVPYLGLIAGGIFAIIAWLGQLMGGVAPGLGGVRDIYALARDRFFGERFSSWLVKINKNGAPGNSALLNLILGIITTTTVEALMIYYYGLPQGAFYALFLSGSNVVAYWFIVHLLSDFGLTSFYYKTKILFKNIRSILVAIVAPIGASVVFLYSFYMGYSSLPEPYFGGFLFVIASLIFSAIYVAILRKRGARWESYITKKIKFSTTADNDIS